MPRQPGPGDSPATGRPGGHPPAAAFSPAQWRILTRLPGQVVVAATRICGRAAAEAPAGTVAAGLAGVAGIAAGRAFDSDLVRAVVATVFAEPAWAESARPRRGPAERGCGTAGPPAPAAALTEAYANCRAAVRVLSGRVDLADSAAYRQWVQSIAAQVCRAARPLPAIHHEPAHGLERRFLAELGKALGLA